jgi:hypothetical protein
MPFIRGRYYMNPIAGEAIEAARAAEAALADLEQSAHDDIANSASSQSSAGANASNGGDDDFADDASCATSNARAARANAGPIHRVEIEAAEVVPSHSGRAQRGFVAHVHREVSAGRPPARASAGFSSGGSASPRLLPGDYPSAAYAPRPETHVFSDHRDLVSFLHDELAKDCRK